MYCLNTSLLILAAMALKAISASVGNLVFSDNSEKGIDFTSPVDSILPWLFVCQIPISWIVSLFLFLDKALFIV